MLLAVLAGCEGIKKVPCEAVIAPENPLVVRVSWETPVAGDSFVEYTSEDITFSSPVTADSTSHIAHLLGLHALKNVAFTAMTEGENGKTYACEGEIRTENLPSGTPALTITANVPEKQAAFQYLMGAVSNTSGSRIFVIGRDGRFVSHTMPRIAKSNVTENLFIEPGISTSIEFTQGFDLAQTLFITRDTESNVLSELNVPNAHHVFGRSNDGTLGIMLNDQRPWQDPVTQAENLTTGDSVQEIAPDGTITELWNTWDAMDPWPAITVTDPLYPTAGPWAWTHGNAIFANDERNSWTFGMARARTVVEIDRETGGLVRSFYSDVSHMKDGSGQGVVEGLKFVHAHDPHFTEEGTLLMFAMHEDRSQTGAFEYAIESDGLHEIWRYDPGLLSYALGQATRLENGNTLVTFATSGLVREVTPEGEVVWELTAPLSHWFGNVYPVNDLWTGN